MAGAKRAKAGGGAPSGSKLKFSLSEASSVTVAIAFKAAGRRAGKKCVAPGKAKPGAKQCARYLAKGTLALKGVAGANEFDFSGKLRGKPLAPGQLHRDLDRPGQRRKRLGRRHGLVHRRSLSRRPLSPSAEGAGRALARWPLALRSNAR